MPRRREQLELFSLATRITSEYTTIRITSTMNVKKNWATQQSQSPKTKNWRPSEVPPVLLDDSSALNRLPSVHSCSCDRATEVVRHMRLPTLERETFSSISISSSVGLSKLNGPNMVVSGIGSAGGDGASRILSVSA